MPFDHYQKGWIRCNHGVCTCGSHKEFCWCLVLAPSKHFDSADVLSPNNALDLPQKHLESIFAPEFRLLLPASQAFKWTRREWINSIYCDYIDPIPNPQITSFIRFLSFQLKLPSFYLNFTISSYVLYGLVSHRTHLLLRIVRFSSFFIYWVYK